MEKDCLFCKIIQGSIPSKKVYEDDDVLAFWDINPQSPVHIIVIPKKHISSLKDASVDDEKLMGHIQIVAAKIAKDFPELQNGFRVVNNCGKDAGQTVFHIHYHLIGGKVLQLALG